MGSTALVPLGLAQDRDEASQHGRSRISKGDQTVESCCLTVLERPLRRFARHLHHARKCGRKTGPSMRTVVHVSATHTSATLELPETRVRF